MKRALLFLFVTSLILFTSCDNAVEEEPAPSTLALDLQNGYWETHFTSGARMVFKFNTSTTTSYWIEGNPLCIVDINIQDYTLEGNMLTLGDDPNPATVELLGDNLTLTWEADGFDGIVERKLTLDYPDC